MGRITWLAAAAATAIVAGGAGVAVGATGKPGGLAAANPGAVVVHRVLVPAARVKAFWTPSRLRRARPVRLPGAARARRAVPFPRVGRPMLVRGTTPRVGLPTRNRSRIWTDHRRMPATTVGKLFFRTRKGTGYCTATVITAPNESTVWTAGHCVSDGAGRWYRDFLFQPDRHDGVAPFGSFTPRYESTTRGYFYHRMYAYDLAALAMTGRGPSLQDRVGSQGFWFGTHRYRWRHVIDFGYPANLIPGPDRVSSEKLRYCAVSTSRYRKSGMMLYRCDMGFGSSGGPLLWHLRRSRGWGYLVGDNSLLQLGTPNRLSPQLGAAAVNVYNAIKNK